MNEGEVANQVVISKNDRTKIPDTIVVADVKVRIERLFQKFFVPKNNGTRLFELFQVVGIDELDLEYENNPYEVSQFEA